MSIFDFVGDLIHGTLFEPEPPEEQLLEWVEGHREEMAERSVTEEDERPKRGMRAQDLRRIEKRNVRRRRAAASVDGELAQEVRAARAGGVSEEERAEIVARKELEGDLEMRHGLEITGLAGGGTWNADQLAEMDLALQEVPAAHLRAIELFNLGDREADGGDARGSFNPKTHVLNMFQDAKLKGGTNTGKASELRGRAATRRYAANTGTPVADVLQHEIGHAVSVADPDAYQAFKAAAGWTDVGEDGQPAELGDEPVVKDGKVVQANRYGKGHVARDLDAIPAGAQWDTAGQSPEEHFAEVYAKAIQVPEELHQQMIAAPEEQLQEAVAALVQAQLADIGAITDGDPKRQGAELNQALARVKREQRRLDSRRAQWTIMREQVFGVTGETVEQQARLLASSGASPDKVDEFRSRAAQAMTPRQLERLAARCRG